MKRKGYLWDDVIDIENVYQAMVDYNRNRPRRLRRRPCYQRAARIAETMARDFAVAIGKPRKKTIFECGKLRDLEIPGYISCIAQIALWRICWKYVERRVHLQSYSSRKKMGGHLAARKCERFVRTNINGKAKYFLYFDIKKFYAHINKRIMMDRLERIFKDEKVLDAFKAVVYSTENGIPIGYPFSHALANLYLVPLYFLAFSLGKRQYRVSKIYVYMDNWTVFAQYKKVLHRVKDAMAEWLERMGCAMKGDWQIAPTRSRRVKVCGFSIGAGRTRLYRRIWRRTVRNVDRLCQNPQNERLYRSLMSRLGWLKAIHKEHSAAFAAERGKLWQ